MGSTPVEHSVLNVKAVVAAFNQEKALVGAFSVITNLRMELFQALVCYQTGVIHPENWGLQLDKNYIFSFRYKLKNKYQINYKINYTIPWRPPAQPRPSASDR